MELLLTLITWPFRDETRSVVGKSRLDEETQRFWKWVTAAVLVASTVAWLICHR